MLSLLSALSRGTKNELALALVLSSHIPKHNKDVYFLQVTCMVIETGVASHDCEANPIGWGDPLVSRTFYPLIRNTSRSLLLNSVEAFLIILSC